MRIYAPVLVKGIANVGRKTLIQNICEGRSVQIIDDAERDLQIIV